MTNQPQGCSQAAGGLGLGAGRPLSLDTTIGQEFGPCGRIENATVRDLLAMKVRAELACVEGRPALDKMYAVH